MAKTRRAPSPGSTSKSRIRGLGDALGDEMKLPVHATDAVVNAYTGTGTVRSKTTFNRYVAGPDLDPSLLELLFRENPIARRIVTKLPDTALRAGFTIRRAGADPKADLEQAHKLLARFKALKGPKLAAMGAKWARLHGGGGLILAAAGSGPLSEPLNDEDVIRLERFLEWDAQQLQEVRWYPDGNVSHYMYTPRRTGPTTGPIEVHESRVLAFPGAEATLNTRAHNHGWDDSVLKVVYETLMAYDGSWASITDMFSDASQAVFKLSGLIEALAEGNGSDGVRDVLTRLRTLDLTRGTSRALVLDAGVDGKGGEEFDTIDRTGFGTLAPMVGQLFVRVAAAADMPMTVLLGMSPAGADATGESDLALWFNSVDVYRQQLTPIFERIIRIIAYAAKDEDPESWEIVWPELQRPTPLEIATARNMTVTSLTQLIRDEVATPEEVALSMTKWVEEGLSGLQLDVESRQIALEEALKEVKERSLGESEASEGPGLNGSNDPDDDGESDAPTAGGPGATVPPDVRVSERRTPAKAAGRQI